MENNNTLILELTQKEIELILQQLAELPAKYSYSLIEKIHKQSQPQMYKLEK